MEFYSVKHREKVNVPDNQIKKKKFNADSGESSRTRYAVVAQGFEHKGDKLNLTKFISKDTFESLKVDEVK
jgi:hypothetical protein